MSQETSNWLNDNIRVGFTEKRGTAWWNRTGTTSEGQPNHFEGAVPLEVVQDLFPPLEAHKLKVSLPEKKRAIEVPDRIAVLRMDTLDVLGVFKDGYQIHQYNEWLLQNVMTLLDDSNLAIGSAGLLQNGAVAWVSVEVPENIVTPEGVEFRPNLLAATSCNGTLATTYKRIITNVVCDNTMRAGLSEKGQSFKVKHSKHSMTKIGDARAALHIIHQAAEDFMAEVAQLCSVEVTDAQWSAFLEAHAAMPEEDGRGKTVTERKWEELTQLWNSDPMVSPWKGTAFGVVQAVNTWDHYKKGVRKAGDDTDGAKALRRAEVNMLAATKGEYDELDAQTLDTLRSVLV